MATGHLNPGYGDTVSKLRRSKSAVPFQYEDIGNFTKPLDVNILDEIRSRARETWARPHTAHTTYNHFHNDSNLRNFLPTSSRPTSPSRKHKPHPPLVFLSNRLHYIEGFQNPDDSLGKRLYRVDGSDMSPLEKAYRDSIKAKYVPRPHTAAVLQYKTTQGLDVLDPTDAQTTEAWLKMSSEKDKQNIIEKLKELDVTTERIPRPTPIPSLRGYLKQAGYRDKSEWERLQKNLKINPHTYSSRRRTDATNVGRSIYKPSSMRGDYLIHPDWPPALPHHKLPCLC